MSVGRAEAELPHAPRLVPQRLHDVGAAGEGALVVVVDCVNDEVSEIGMVAQLGGGNRIGTRLP